MLALAITLLTQTTFAHEISGDKLLSEFTALDNLLFEESFNKCRTEVLPPIISADFEFYHDIAGIQNKAEFLQAVENNICSNRVRKTIRKLVPDSMEIFPLKKNNVIYGVIQRGIHEFYLRETGKDIRKQGVAKFTHLWLLNNGKWQLKRVLSFDHQAVTN